MRNDGVVDEEVPSVPVPEPSAVSGPYWEATKSKSLTMQRCLNCRRMVWYPRFVCPHCSGDDLAWEALSGRGVVYAVSVHHRPALPALANTVPYAVVLIDLEEGARIMSNVFGVPPQVGDEVTVAWVPLPDGRHLPTFERS